MDNVFNLKYLAVTRDLIHDIFYADTSNRNKISAIRQCAEILVRALFGFTSRLTLGDKKTLQHLNDFKAKGHYHAGIAYSILFIRDMGNLAAHTDYAREISDIQCKACLFHLAKVYAFFFVQYFIRHPLGTNYHATTMFSFLPEKFRLLILITLHRLDKENFDVLENMIILLVNVHGQQRSLYWTERNKAKLMSITKAKDNKVFTAYDIALHHIHKTELYQVKQDLFDFQTAVKSYRKFVSEMSIFQSKDVETLKGIMDFLYLGVK